MDVFQELMQVAYKPIEIQKGIWMADDIVDYLSNQTLFKLYTNDGQFFHEINCSYENKTAFADGIPITLDFRLLTEDLVKRIRYHYDDDSVLIKTTICTSLDNFTIQTVQNKYFHLEDSIICQHYLNGKPYHYTITTHSANRTTIQYARRDRKVFQIRKLLFANDLLKSEVIINLPSQIMQRYLEYLYNKDGMCLSKKHYCGAGKLTKHEIFGYDIHSNCILKKIIQMPSGIYKETKTLFEYNSEGVWIRKVIYENGIIRCFVDNKYIKMPAI